MKMFPLHTTLNRSSNKREKFLIHLIAQGVQKNDLDLGGESPLKDKKGGKNL